jgi:hypothetical protein
MTRLHTHIIIPIHVGILPTDAHQKLFEQLAEHATKWREIGMFLGFSQGKLDEIQGQPGLFFGGSSGYLNEMLTKWLQWRHDSGSPDDPTLDKLKKAMDKAGLAASAQRLIYNS